MSRVQHIITRKRGQPLLSRDEDDPTKRLSLSLPESQRRRLAKTGPSYWSDGRKIREAIADWLDRHERTR